MKSNVLISELLDSTLCQHGCEMEWERGEGPWLTHVPLHILKSGAGGNRTCCTHPKKPAVTSPCSPVLSSVSVVVAVTISYALWWVWGVLS